MPIGECLKALEIVRDMPEELVVLAKHPIVCPSLPKCDYDGYPRPCHVASVPSSSTLSLRMSINVGIFGDGTNLKDRFVRDYKKLAQLVRRWKELGLRVVLTSGTWDLFHVGHADYLEKAKKMGDLLIVGVDSDEKVRARKGPHRPVVPQKERILILSHLRHVDAITLKPLSERPNELIKLVRPDILVMSKSTKHSKKDIAEKKKFAKKIVLLEPQARTSTSAKVRLLHVSGADQFAKELVPQLTSLVDKQLVEGSRNLARAIATDIPAIMEDVLRQIGTKK